MEKHNDNSADEFAELIQSTIPLVYNTLNKEFRDKCIVEDIIQSAIECAYRGFNGYRGEANFKNWFFAIVKNIKINFYREQTKHKNVIAIETAFTNNEENIAAWDWFHHSFNDDIDNISLREGIRHVLSYLPSSDRELINKIFFEDKSTRQIAAELNKTEEHIRVRKQRALDKLKIIIYIDKYEEELSREAESVYLRFMKEELSKNEKALALEILLNRTSFEELAEITGTDEDVLRVRYLRILNKLSDYIRRQQDE